MKALRHRLGRWLLRDFVVPRQEVTVHIDGKMIHSELLRYKRKTGRPLGLS